MDRRYAQARGASDRGSRRSEAYTRAMRVRARASTRGGYSANDRPGERGLNAPGSGEISRQRALELQRDQEVFDMEGSGVYGSGGLKIRNPGSLEPLGEGLL